MIIPKYGRWMLNIVIYSMFVLIALSAVGFITGFTQGFTDNYDDTHPIFGIMALAAMTYLPYRYRKDLFISSK